MAATNIIIYLQSGKSINAYVPASAAVGDYLPVSKVGPATANSPDEVRLDANDVITDVFFTSPSGAVEIMNNDNPTGRHLFAEVCQAANAGRKHFTIGLTAGSTYRLRVSQGFPA